MKTEKIYITADELANTCTDKESQETTIGWVRGDEKVVIDTSDNTFITKMKNLMLRDPEHYKCYYYSNNVDNTTGKVLNYIFEIDRNLLSFRVSTTKKKGMNESEKKALVERLKKNN